MDLRGDEEGARRLQRQEQKQHPAAAGGASSSSSTRRQAMDLRGDEEVASCLGRLFSLPPTRPPRQCVPDSCGAPQLRRLGGPGPLLRPFFCANSGIWAPVVYALQPPPPRFPVMPRRFPEAALEKAGPLSRGIDRTTLPGDRTSKRKYNTGTEPNKKKDRFTTSAK